MINYREYVKFIENLKRAGVDLEGKTLMELMGAIKVYNNMKGVII